METPPSLLYAYGICGLLDAWLISHARKLHPSLTVYANLVEVGW